MDVKKLLVNSYNGGMVFHIWLIRIPCERVVAVLKSERFCQYKQISFTSSEPQTLLYGLERKSGQFHRIIVSNYQYL